MRFIAALNSLLLGVITALNTINTPLTAICVIVIGMYFALQANKAGLPSDIASGVIGAGIGLLTGQALQSQRTQMTDGHASVATQTPAALPPQAPTPPVAPAQAIVVDKETP